VSAVPQPRPARVAVRRGHLGALLAAIAYGVAAFTLFQLVSPALQGEREKQPEAAVAAAPPAQTGLSAVGPEALAVRAVASRAQRSAYLVESAGGGSGSGFVAWVHQGKVSFVLTARAVVEGVLADGGRTAYVKRGSRFWPARIVRADRGSGLALLRVEAPLDRPLWQEPRDLATLEAGAKAVIVPAGSDAPFGEGNLAPAEGGGLALRAGGEERYVGAPVVAAEGELGGIVVGFLPSGESRIIPLGDACGTMRRC
jgi:hypothetical protein